MRRSDAAPRSVNYRRVVASLGAPEAASPTAGGLQRVELGPGRWRSRTLGMRPARFASRLSCSVCTAASSSACGVLLRRHTPGHFTARAYRRPLGSWRDAARACSSGRSASRMSWKSPSVVSNFCGFKEICTSSGDARFPRSRTYRTSNRMTTTASEIRAASTESWKRRRTRL